MPTLQLYDKLLQLPLFQGMGQFDLSAIVGQTKFGFMKTEKGKTVVRADEICDQLLFLLNGQLQVESLADDHSYTFIEEIAAPAVLQPEHIFGLTQRYSKTFKAIDTCNFLTLRKDEVLRLSDEYLIFRINLLGYISTLAQKLAREPWRKQSPSARNRMIRFFFQHSMRPAGKKTIRIRMVDLANEINDSRLNVSRALNDMQAEGLVKLGRGEILIPQLERLTTI
ncbi:MAG: Crp/Fnr family transcriptional regulator [Prevotella sp.]|nr:Crp/Fnr family transcriptional regulator [Prevotella sp.]